MYSLVRPLLFRLDPEFSHTLTLSSLDICWRLGLMRWLRGYGDVASLDQPVRVMGLDFPNPVGLAAGLDKSGDHFNALGALGFGFVEVGTVTPRPQRGNTKPRLFRLPQDRAIINRMGFNNKGVEHLVGRLRERRYRGVLGVNLGKNATTALADAVSDYRAGMQRVYAFADYIAINISSPNTPGLRELQFGQHLQSLLAALKNEQRLLAEQHGRYVPVAVKIAPDMSEGEITKVAAALLAAEIDGVIATNTTLERGAVVAHPRADEKGGLSGAPLTHMSTRVIAQLYGELGDKIPIIGVGGIMSGEDAVAKMRAGARLIQLYSGFIYRGPKLITEAADAIASAFRSVGAGTQSAQGE